MEKEGDYYQSRKFLNLLASYESAKSKGEPYYLEADDMADIADYYYMIGNADKAIETADEAIEIFPDASGPLSVRAHIALDYDNDLETAKSCVKRIIDTNDLDYVKIYAEILIFEKKDDEATEYLNERFQETDEDDRDDFALETASIYLNYGMPKTAKLWVNRCADKDCLDYLEIHAEICEQLGDLEHAEADISKLVDIDPYSIDYWCELGRVQGKLGKIEESIQSCDFALAIQPQCEEALYTKSNCLLVLGNLEDALACINKCIANNFEKSLYHLMSGTILLNLNRISDSEKELLKTLKLAHEDEASVRFGAYELLATIYLQLYNPEEAIKLFDKLTSDVSDNERAEVAIIKGKMLIACGKTDEGTALFDFAAAQAEQDPALYYSLAQTATECGMYEYALDKLNIMFQKLSDKTVGYACKAYCHLMLHQRSLYLTSLKHACEVNPNEVRIIFEKYLNGEITNSNLYNYLKDLS